MRLLAEWTLSLSGLPAELGCCEQGRKTPYLVFSTCTVKTRANKLPAHLNCRPYAAMYACTSSAVTSALSTFFLARLIVSSAKSLLATS